MGIPVVETGDKWHYDIGQKVPLTLDRENVPPAFLRQVRVAVFNRMHTQLVAEDVNSQWAETAIASADCASDAVVSYVNKRFGEKRVSFDPSDPEANKLAVSHGLHDDSRRPDVDGSLAECQDRQRHPARWAGKA